MMDVRCSQCSTEYEFERARVPVEGLSVKCSQCGCVFKVYRDDQSAGGIWKVRQQNGNLFEFRELTTLQRWIVERKVDRQDEISKTSKNWKRLGDIAELATFFQVVDRAHGPPAALPSHAPSTGGDSVALSNQPTVRQPVLPAMSPVPIAGFGVPGNPAMQTPAATYAPVQTLQPVAQAAPAPAPAYAPAAAPAPAPQLEPTLISDSGDDDFDDLDDFGRSGGKGKWIAAAILLLGIAVGGVYLAKPELLDQLLAPKIPELALSHVKTGYTELRKDSNAAIERAISNFEKAIALADTYGDAKAGLAEALIARAEWQLEEATDLKANLEAQPEQERAAPAAKVKELYGASDRLAERAFGVGKESLVIDPTGLAPNRAMADYYRFKQAPDQMAPLLERAKAAGPKDPGIAYVIGSSMMVDAASAERAARYFDQALEAAPDMQRARYKLARAYLLQGNKQRALLHAKAILDAVPDHDRAKALVQVLEPPPPPQPEEKTAPEEPLSFDRLVSQADRVRGRDQPRKAMHLYEKALEIQGDDPDALTGLGWCYFDVEMTDAAIATFNRVIAQSPGFSDAHMGLANAYEEKNMRRDAIKHYQKYLDILPDGPEAPVAHNALKRLQ